MVFLLIVALLLALASAIFAVQNALPVTLTFLHWHFESSLAVAILLAVLAGVLMTAAILGPILLHRSWRISRLTRQLEKAHLQPDERDAPPE